MNRELWYSKFHHQLDKLQGIGMKLGTVQNNSLTIRE